MGYSPWGRKERDTTEMTLEERRAAPLKGGVRRAERQSVAAEHFREAVRSTAGSVFGARNPRRRSVPAMGRNKKKKRDGDDRRQRLILSFDEEKRR